MKQILIILTLLMPALAFGQYPASPTTKVDLGRQTTGDGLTFRTSGAPSWTPTGKNNAWTALDTVAGVLYLYDGSAAEWLPVSSERTLYPIVKNVAGVTLAAGTVVAVDETNPATGDKLNVVAAEGDGTKPAKLIVGILVQSLANNGEGRAAWFGIVKGLSLPTLQPVGETWAEGDILYLSGSVNGGLTKTEPARPALDLPVAVITRISSNNLTLLVRPQLGEKLGELHDVSVAGVTNGQVLTYNDTTGLWVARTPTGGGGGISDGDKGEITVSSGGTVWTIDNDVVTAAKIASGAVGESELASDAVTAAKIATAAVGADEIATGAVGSDELASSAVIEAKIANDAVTAAKIASGAVGTTEIADSAVVSAKIPASNITTEKLATGAVTADKIGTGAVTEAKIGTDAVTAAKIAADAVGSSEIASGAVGEAELASSAVTEGKIANDAVTAAKIATGAVGADELASTAVVAGSYTAANITVDPDGRITAAANGSGGGGTPAGSTGEIQYNNAGAFGASANLFWDATDSELGVGTNTPAARVHIVGTGATSATTALLVRNSTPSDLFQILNNGRINQTVPSSSNTTLFGSGAGGSASLSGSNNAFFGTNAGLNTTTGLFNTFVGAGAGQNNTTGNFNSFFGKDAGSSNTTGSSNTFLGISAGGSNTTASNSTFVGFQAGLVNSSGGSNTFIGAGSGQTNTTGESNTFIGNASGQYNTTASSNTFVGTSVGLNNTTGASNTFIGASAGINNTTAGNNVFIGTNAALNNTTGANNTLIGANAGRYVNAGGIVPIITSSVLIGDDTRVNADNETNQIVIGQASRGNGSNTVTLGNSSIVGHYLSGTGAVRVPTGTTAQRPTGVQGFVRYNTTTMELDVHDGTSYRRVVDIADATPNTGDVVSWTGSAFSAVASRRGVLSGTPDGSGDLTLTFGTAMPDATYSATATAEGTTAYIITVHTKATGSVKFRVFNDAGVAVTSGTITVNYQITDY